MKIFSKKNLKNPKGFTLIELLIVIAIIGILASVAFPQFAQYRARSFGSQVEAELHHIYLACKAFWGDNTSTADCTQVLITAPLYGFVSNAAVTPAFTAGVASQEAAFAVTATHASLPAATFYTVNQNGTITRTGNLG